MKLLMSGIDQEYTSQRTARASRFSEYAAAKEYFSDVVADCIHDVQRAESRIKWAEDEAARITATYNERLEKERDRFGARMKRDRENLDSTIEQFKRDFGVDPTHYNARRRIEVMAQRLNKDNEIDGLRNIIERTQDQLHSGLSEVFEDVVSA